MQEGDRLCPDLSYRLEVRGLADFGSTVRRQRTVLKRERESCEPLQCRVNTAEAHRPERIS